MGFKGFIVPIIQVIAISTLGAIRLSPSQWVDTFFLSSVSNWLVQEDTNMQRGLAGCSSMHPIYLLIITTMKTLGRPA
ncbi:hypothetical protein BDV37DRAFT_242435 [Aspergillus pseudonomiae]|uniref:Uncharacterized protein n=1 Tax=Aspergillus pseudonomiae TaxID=1506151 RepID=A0A5N7DJW2_9EURO|nr:uncharacterized protein BDV37DRAFT_242435 [Aspergillus pseudonomiae]KAE8406721.1 hypothetical protein BDV37DRAFT_242435 [Aspergillus pseudonomiae]